MLMKTGIIGAGTLGSWFADHYTKNGRDVLITDSNIDRANLVAKNTNSTATTVEHLIDECEEIAIAVSLSAVSKVVDSHSFESKIVYDFASIKRDVVDQLAAKSTRSYSLHPMWGGSTPSFKNQNLIMIPTHHNDIYNTFFQEQQQRFTDFGCTVHVLPSGQEHDKHIAWTLGLYHFGMLTLGSTVAKSKRTNHRAFAGTTQRAVNIPLEAVLSSNQSLYADIQMFNPYTREVISTMRQVLDRYERAIIAGDRIEFAQMMQEAKTFFMESRDKNNYFLDVRKKFQAAANL